MLSAQIPSCELMLPGKKRVMSPQTGAPTKSNEVMSD